MIRTNEDMNRDELILALKEKNEEIERLTQLVKKYDNTMREFRENKEKVIDALRRISNVWRS